MGAALLGIGDIKTEATPLVYRGRMVYRHKVVHRKKLIRDMLMTEHECKIEISELLSSLPFSARTTPSASKHNMMTTVSVLPIFRGIPSSL